MGRGGGQSLAEPNADLRLFDSSVQTNSHVLFLFTATYVVGDRFYTIHFTRY